MLKTTTFVAALALAPFVQAQTYDLSEASREVGEAFSGTFSMNIGPGDINLDQGGQKMTMTMTMEQSMAADLVVTEVDDQGMVTAYEQTLSEQTEAQTVVFMGQTQETDEPSLLVGKTITYVLNDEGEFEPQSWEGATPEELTAAESTSHVLFDNDMLPDGPVAVGDSWNPDLNDGFFGEESQDMEGAVTCTLEEVREQGGHDIAVISIVIEMSGANGDFGPGGQMSMNMQGTWLRDLDTGIDLDLDLEGTMTMDMAQQGMSMQGELPMIIQGSYESQ